MENRCRVISCVKSVKVSQGTKIAPLLLSSLHGWLCGYDSLKPILRRLHLGISQVKVSNEALAKIWGEMKSG